ncbi:MAG: flagellar basal body-associated protein FliL [Sulfuricellaceae bacterium]
MAKGKTVEKPVEAPPAKPKKTKLIILAIVAVLLLGGGGLSTLYLMSDGKKKGDSRHSKEEKEKLPVFVTLEKFTVNLPSADGVDHFLMIGVDVMVEDVKTAEVIKAHMPEIRNGLLLLLSSRTVEGLSTLEGKKKLSADIVKQVNEPLHLKEGEKAALDALFSEFVIQ